MSFPRSSPRLHPQSTEDPRLMRWLTEERELSVDSPRLAALLADGTLAGIWIESGEVRTLLAPNRSWATDGPRVRSALFQALSESDGQRRLGQDELRQRIEEILRCEVAPVAGSHGGSVTVQSLADGVLTVDFGGACAGCTARGTTLRGLVARVVRDRYPQVTEVRAARRRTAWLGPLQLRRRQ